MADDEHDVQLDLLDAIDLKKSTLEEVADNNVEWLEQALTAMKRLPNGTLGIAEDFRFKLIDELGVPPPRTHKAWGAFTRVMLDRGEFVWTGRRLPMRAKRSKGRKSDEYEYVKTPAKKAA